MNLFITVSGCGGGAEGPQGIYQHLQKSEENSSLKVLPFDTLPNDTKTNVENVARLVLENQGNYKNIYLVGHSMGGAIVTQAAHQLNEKSAGSVKGIVLLNTQVEGLNDLKKTTIPVLFYHGKEDQYFPIWQYNSIYKRCLGPRRVVHLENLDHDFAPGKNGPKLKGLTQDLASDLLAEISSFFLKDTQAESQTEIITRPIALSRKESRFTLPSLNFLFKKSG